MKTRAAFGCGAPCSRLMPPVRSITPSSGTTRRNGCGLGSFQMSAAPTWVGWMKMPYSPRAICFGASISARVSAFTLPITLRRWSSP